MEIDFTGELSPTALGEMGHPTGAWRRASGDVDVLASRFGDHQWAARAMDPATLPQHRLAVYSGALSRLVAVFDGARYPINDVAIHPTHSVMAVGTGSYDGGWMFEGELWLWNWETGEVRNLLPSPREVVRCRWDGDDSLLALLRPQDEESFAVGDGDPFELTVSLSLQVRGLLQRTGPLEHLVQSTKGQATWDLDDSQPCDPKALGFEDGADPTDANLARALERLKAVDWEERTQVWDLCWTGSDTLAAASQQCLLETWNTATGERTFCERGEGHGVELIPAAEGLIVNVFSKMTPTVGPPSTRSRLMRFAANQLDDWRSFDFPVTVSSSLSGALLCRCARWGASRPGNNDVLLSPTGDVLQRMRLGDYDLFNHYLRINGGHSHYFLRGSKGMPHEDKRLMRLDERGKTEVACDWDSPRVNVQRACACIVQGSAIVRSYSDYRASGRSFLERIEPRRRGTSAWKVEVAAPVTALVAEGDLMVCALSDGVLSVHGPDDGGVMGQITLEVGGVPTVGTALALQGSRLAVGTMDGRVLLYQLA